MSIVLRSVLIAITIIYILILIRSINKKNLQISFSVFWIISGIILIIALLIPNFVEWISHKLGFVAPSNMVFCLTIFIAFYLIFNMTIKLAQEHKKNVTLIQEVSMLKKRVENLEKKKKSK